MKRWLLAAVITVSADLLGQSAMRADERDFTWAPIEEEHWAESGAGFSGSPPAVIVFERISSDESGLADGHCILRVVQRIKVLRKSGVSSSDVDLPFVADASSMRHIAARSVHRDGRVYSISERDVLNGIVLSTSAGIVKRKTLPIPGVEPGCLIDLYVEFENKEPTSTWDIQRELPLRSGVYSWRPWSPGLKGEYQRAIAAELITPNFLWVHPEASRFHFDSGRPEVAVGEQREFNVSDVPALKPAHLELGGNQMMLLLYYGSFREDQEYWLYVAHATQSRVEESEGVNVLEPWAAEVASRTTKRDRIDTAFEFVSHSLQSDEEAILDRGRRGRIDIARALRDRRGTPLELAIVLWRILGRAGVEAEIAFARDRRSGPVFQEAKFWQFNSVVVLARDDTRNMVYCVPSDKSCAAGALPWYLEGTEALVLQSVGYRFVRLGRSSANDNVARLTLDLALTDSDELEGSVRWVRTGHRAWEGRHELGALEDSISCHARASREIAALLPDATTSSVDVRGLAEGATELEISAVVRFSGSVATEGASRAIRPFALMRREPRPFAEERNDQPVELPFAFTDSTFVRIRLTERIDAAIVPSVEDKNGFAGRVRTTFAANGRELTADRVFRVDQAAFEAKHVPLLEDLLHRKVRSREAVVLLQSQASGP